MINSRENIKHIINKIFKYIILFSIVLISCHLILKDKILLFQSILISLICCTTYIIIEQVSPTYIVNYEIKSQ